MIDQGGGSFESLDGSIRTSRRSQVSLPATYLIHRVSLR